ncbi:repeat-containing lipoprotein [Citrifermentans bemidjiense Bem]|uniref:Repeat-containing lipoprotein n=1 Tax=Citrifermentans bemidjiense (strain ATCC BAA-1014 / DSM 16622 / JCM 12645 / Bem) TaxID=404380 RepID=B5EH55_CITBB|nr:hypothetical protein [Citrifermentans bemidjiense]ACH38157.1 repeat-containing lipoprotein [Citrifermentans bemidjiense Bem]
MKKMQMFGSCTALTLMAVAFAGCTTTGQAAKQATAPVTAAAPAVLSGKVLETVDSGGYTYMNLEKDGQKTWVAAPVMKVSVGQEVQLLPGAQMANFSSKTLNRTFEKITFSAGAIAPTAPAAPAAPAAAEPLEEVVMIGKVIETMPAGNYTYIRIEKDSKAAWAAVPKADVVVGDEVELAPGTPMGSFTSKTLNRTFNSIYFAGGITITSRKEGAAPAAPATENGLPSGHPKLDAAAALPSGHPSVDAAAPAAPAPAANISGKVVETINGGGYTYVCLEHDGNKTWVAVPSMKANVGDEIAVLPGNVMANFASKSLNRTFDKIIFSGGPVAK